MGDVGEFVCVDGDVGCVEGMKCEFGVRGGVEEGVYVGLLFLGSVFGWDLLWVYVWGGDVGGCG